MSHGPVTLNFASTDDTDRSDRSFPYTVTHLELTRSDAASNKTIRVIEQRGRWNEEKDVPRSARDFVAFVRESCVSDATGGVVVSCVNGVCRSGLFLAVLAMVREEKKEGGSSNNSNSSSPYDVVFGLRKRRPGLVRKRIIQDPHERALMYVLKETLRIIASEK